MTTEPPRAERPPSAPMPPPPPDPSTTPGEAPRIPPSPPPLSGPSMLWEVFESVMTTLGLIGIVILVVLAIILFPFIIMFFCGVLCWAVLCGIGIIAPFIIVYMAYDFYKGQRRDEYRSLLLQQGYSPQDVDRIIREKGL